MQKQPGVIEVAQYRPPKGGGQGYQARNGPSRRKATASAIPSLKSFESEHPIFKAYNEPCTRALSGPKPPGKYLTRSISGPSTFDNPPTSLRCLTGKIVEPGTESQRRIIRIGIEAEFEIASFVPEYSMDHLRLGEFVKTIARNYNKQVPEWHPRMREGIRSGNADDTYHEWCLVLDPTVRASQDSFCEQFPFRSVRGTALQGRS